MSYKGKIVIFAAAMLLAMLPACRTVCPPEPVVPQVVQRVTQLDIITTGGTRVAGIDRSGNIDTSATISATSNITSLAKIYGEGLDAGGADIDNVADISLESISSGIGSTISISGCVAVYDSDRDITDLHHLVDKEYVDEAVTALGARYYMLDDDSGEADYKECSTTPSASGEQSVSKANLSDDDYIQGWIAPNTNEPDRLLIGVYNWRIYAEKTGGTKTLRLYWKLVERKSDDSEVVIGTSVNSNEIVSGKNSYIIPLTLSSDYDVANDSYVVGKVYADVSGNGSAPDVTLYYEGDSASHWQIPVNREIFNDIYVNVDGDTMTGALATSSTISATSNITSLAKIYSVGMDAGDADITNVGDIALDSISSDAGTSVNVVLGSDAGDDFTVDTDKLVVEGDTGNVGIGTTGPGNELEVYNGTYPFIDVNSGNVKVQMGVHTGESIGLIQTKTNHKLFLGAGDRTDNIVLDTNGNVGIGTTTPGGSGTTGTKVLSLGNGTAPVGGVADQVSLFSKDVAGSAELFALDESGNTPQLTPHNFDLFTPDEDFKYPWSYYACNQYLGTCINVDMAFIAQWVQEQSGRQVIFYEDMPEDEILSWEEQQQLLAERINAQRLAEAAAVLTPTARIDAIEAYSETVIVGTGEFITKTITTYELNEETGEVEEVVSYEVTEVTEEVPTGRTLYRLKERCELNSETGEFLCPVGEENAVYEPYEPQPMPEWMQERFITVILAPQDISGLEKPEGTYKKLVNIGSQAALWAGWAESEALLGLHEQLWEMNPKGTFGILAAVKTRNESFYDHRVRRATGMTAQQALARRNRIADYLDSLGKDTTLLRAATTEDAMVRGIVDALGYTMDQLWNAMKK